MTDPDPDVGDQALGIVPTRRDRLRALLARLRRRKRTTTCSPQRLGWAVGPGRLSEPEVLDDLLAPKEDS